MGGTERDNTLVKAKEPFSFFACGDGQVRVTAHDKRAHRGTEAFLHSIVRFAKRQVIALREEATDRRFA